MTDHADISRRLALAIGYREYQVADVYKSYCTVSHETGPKNSGRNWYVFDYRDPEVIWPIAERFNCFPTMHRDNCEWYAYMLGGRTTWADTAALAVALAVIKAKEKSCSN